MWKVVILAAGMIVYPTNQAQSPTHSQAVSQEQRGEGSPNPLAVQSNPESCEGHYHQYDHDRHRRNWLETAYFISGPVIGLLTFVTAIAVMKQIGSQRKADRPWIMLSEIDQGADWDERSKQMMQMAHWRIKNYGKTPAFIESVTGHVSLARDIAGVKRLQFKAPVRFAFEPVIAPGQQSNLVYIEADEFTPIEIMQNLGIPKPEYRIVAAGKIIYRDSFKKKRSSTFCYAYVFGPPEIAGFIEICGPDSYNEYT